jgi:hypothetical protein
LISHVYRHITAVRSATELVINFFSLENLFKATPQEIEFNIEGPTEEEFNHNVDVSANAAAEAGPATNCWITRLKVDFRNIYPILENFVQPGTALLVDIITQCKSLTHLTIYDGMFEQET